MPISHDFKIAEGGVHIKHYNQAILNFNAEKMKGVGLGLLFWNWTGVFQGWNWDR